MRTVKLDHFPRDRGENFKKLKPPPSSISLSLLMELEVTHPEFSFPKPNPMVRNLWIHNTVDGRNLANQLVDSLSHYLLGFLTYQLVQDFFHQQYYPSSFVPQKSCNLDPEIAVCFFSMNPSTVEASLYPSPHKNSGTSGFLDLVPLHYIENPEAPRLGITPSYLPLTTSNPARRGPSFTVGKGMYPQLR